MRKKCFGCGHSYIPTRSDQLFCSPNCRYKYYHPNLEYLMLPIKKKWYDMILSGEKKEEYREIKPYWEKRFQKHFDWNFGGDDIFEWHFSKRPKKIMFKNGYGNNAPYFIAECTIRIGTGREEWGAEKGKSCIGSAGAKRKQFFHGIYSTSKSIGFLWLYYL